MDEIRIKQKQEARGERRGWIIYLLHLSHPKPLSLRSLMRNLDFYNLPLSRQRLANKLEFLRDCDLLRVFPLGTESVLSDIDQAKLIQRYGDSDGEMDSLTCAMLTARGVRFQEGYVDEIGVVRING